MSAAIESKSTAFKKASCRTKVKAVSCFSGRFHSTFGTRYYFLSSQFYKRRERKRFYTTDETNTNNVVSHLANRSWRMPSEDLGVDEPDAEATGCGIKVMESEQSGIPLRSASMISRATQIPNETVFENVIYDSRLLKRDLFSEMAFLRETGISVHFVRMKSRNIADSFVVYHYYFFMHYNFLIPDFFDYTILKYKLGLRNNFFISIRI